MKKTLWGILFLMVLVSCRDEKTVDALASTSYYFSKDKTQILYDTKEAGLLSFFYSEGSYKEVTKDVDNFSVISRFLAKDSKRIYYKYTPVRNVDYATFSWDAELRLAKDRKHLYFLEFSDKTNTLEILKDADPETYKKVELPIPCKRWYVDKNHYFFLHKRVNADRRRMSFESPYFPYDDKHVFPSEGEKLHQIAYKGKMRVISEQLVRDDHTFYFHFGCDSLLRPIAYKDPATFKYYRQSNKEHLFRIDDHIYLNGNVFMAGIIIAASFELLKEEYARDEKHVYYKSKVLPNADPETFVVLSHKYAKDKNQVYYYAKVLPGYDPEEFKEDPWGRFPSESDYGKEPKGYGGGGRDDD